MLNRIPDRRLILLIPAALLCILSAAICFSVYRRTAAVNDTSAYLFQAKIFAAGKLFAPVPAHPGFFGYEYDMLVMKDDRWFSMYPPGFPLLLAFAMLLKAEWLLVPFLGACTLAIWIEYARRWHSKQVAVLFGVLCLFSPFVFQMFSTPVVHAPELFLASSAIYICRRETEQPARGRKILLLLILLLSTLMRPFSLLIFLSPVLLCTAWDSLKRRSPFFLIAAGAGVLAGIVLTSLYQWKTTGNPMLAPYLLEYPDLKYGFGKNFVGLVHSPARAVEQLSNSLLGMNKWLNGWYSGSLFYIVAFFLTVRRLRKWDTLLLLSCLSLLCFYFFYIAQDLIFGPRFIFLCAPILLLLVSRCCDIGSEPECGQSSSRLCALLAVSFISFFPSNLSKFIWIYDPANDPPEYLKIRLKGIQPEEKIVFLDPQIPQDYINWNDPFLREPVLFCRDLGSRNQEMLAAFPQHGALYFRPSIVSLGAIDPKGMYGFFKERDTSDHSRISFFHLGASLQSTADHGDRDSFDVTYPQLFYTHDAAPQLAFLEGELIRTPETTRNALLKLALIHTSRMLLLPRLAYEKGGFADWSSHLDFQAFRHEMDQAGTFFLRTGEIGKSLHFEIDKVRKRIDLDRNGNLSDAECSRFLSEKILLFARFV